MIIFLNGVSSSGKTLIAKALTHILGTPILTLGIDIFIGMMPPAFVGFGPKSKQGFHFFQKN